MYQIVICDDDKVITNLIESIVYDNMTFLNKDFNLTVFHTGNDLVKFLDNTSNYPDLFLLDVDMPFMTGFDVGRKLQTFNLTNRIIYVSSHPSFIFESQKVFPFYYLRKSEIDSELLYVMQRYFQEYENNNIKHELVLGDFMLPESEILYLEKSDRKTIVQCLDTTFYTINKTLSSVELDCSSDFCKISNSCVVNIRHVSDHKKVSNNYVVIMDNGTQHIITHRFKSTFDKKYIKYRRNLNGQYNIKYN